MYPFFDKGGNDGNGDFQVNKDEFFNVGPPKEDIFSDHFLWSIFQSYLTHLSMKNVVFQLTPT